MRLRGGQMHSGADGNGDDPLARLLEIGLVAIVVGAPMMIGAVQPVTRLTLEIASFTLGVIWLIRAQLRLTPLPPWIARVGMGGLLLLGVLQILPLGYGPTSLLSPETVRVREASVPGQAILDNERELLGTDPAAMESTATLSVDPVLTASALRTGAALAILVLVATTVAATRGVKILAFALLLSAAFQALYGILMLVSNEPMIWHIPKRYFNYSATGTFVNRNHFAGYLAAALPAGLALAIAMTRRARTGTERRFGSLSTTEGQRALLVGLLLALGLAGLILSLSRAGITAGLIALILTAVAAGRSGIRKRLGVVILVTAVACLPLVQLGTDRLSDRFSKAPEHLMESGGRSTVWMDTLEMATQFPVVGTGFGTFAVAYPIYRSATVRYFYDHAHNDALQALSEGGVVGMALLLLILVPLMRAILGTLTGDAGLMAVGIAAGLTALLLHGLVDFNFHIPSNAALAAILAGTVFGQRWTLRN